jgi:hypothetical protein
MTYSIDTNLSLCNYLFPVLLYRILMTLTQSGNWIPVGRDLSRSYKTVYGAQPASYTVVIGSFQGVKKPGRGVDHPPHLAPRLKKG